MESPRIREDVFAHPVLLSPVFHIGEFIGRHFYHHISGFGSVQSGVFTYEGQQGAPSAELKVTWPDLEYIKGTAQESWRDYDDGNLEFVHERVRDDEAISDEIREMMEFQLDDPLVNSLRGIKVYKNGEEVDISYLLDPTKE
jgi:hypothetical protein